MAFIGPANCVITSSISRVTLNTTSLTEANSSYRVAINPFSTSSKIKVTYFIPGNLGGSWAANTIYTYRAFRIIASGSKTYDLGSSGYAHQSRQDIAGMTDRPHNGFDGNDPTTTMFVVWDAPNTTSTCTYGFEWKRETGGGGTMYFGYSQGNGSNWGFDTDVTLIAEEVST